MKAKKVSSKKKSVALLDGDDGKHHPGKLPDLRIPERRKALNKIIDTIESRGVVSSSDMRMIASDKLVTNIRTDRFIEKLCKLIVRTTKKKYYVGDISQPKVEDFSYMAIRELAWRTAESIGLEETKGLVEEALDAIEDDFDESDDC